MKPLGIYLRDARKPIYASHAKAGAAFGVSASSIKRWERGEAVPLDYAVWLAEQRGVSLDELLGLPASSHPREVVLLIDGEPWIAHSERRTEAASRLAAALEDARAFEASRAPQAPQRDRRRRTQ